MRKGEGEGMKERREERNRVGRRGKKVAREGWKKRETGQEVRENCLYFIGFF